MADLQITLNQDKLVELFSSQDGLAKLLKPVLDQILEAQLTEHLKAEPHERTDERQGYRNGYRRRDLTTRVGRLELLIPRDRNGTFRPELFERYQRSEQAFILALIEMVLQGVSTRKVSAIVEELCGTTLSRSTASELCKNLEPRVKEWANRPLDEEEYPFLIVDALVIRVRQVGKVRRLSALIATGVNSQGFREPLGLLIGDSESEASWSELFRQLKDRGLKGVDLVTSDDHTGLVAALNKHFQGASWQRCQFHFTRNILDACPKSLREEVTTGLRRIFNAATQEEARRAKDELYLEYVERAEKAMTLLDEGFDEATEVMRLPEEYRKRLRTSNSQERINREIRRREKVIGIFPNEASAFRLLGALLMEMQEQWENPQNGHRFLEMASYWREREEEAKQMKPAS
jgi:putative transposase